jgi:hypothetical protein
MKKGSKFLALLLVSVFLISFLSYAVYADAASDAAAKATADAKAKTQTMGEYIKSLFPSTGSKDFGLSDNTKAVISKILLTILVILLVYSVVNFIPLLNAKPAIGAWVSIIVGILSFMFVDLNDVMVILTTYEALGVVLTTILPLIIIMTFTIQLRKAEPSMAVFVNKLIMVGFIVYVAIAWWSIPVASAKFAFLYPLTIIISFIWLFLERWIYWRVFGAALAGNTEDFGRGTITLNEMKIRELEEKLDKASDPSEIKILTDKIKKLKVANTALRKIV